MNEKTKYFLILAGKSIAVIGVIVGGAVLFDNVLDARGVSEDSGQWISLGVAGVLATIAFLLRKKIF